MVTITFPVDSQKWTTPDLIFLDHTFLDLEELGLYIPKTLIPKDCVRSVFLFSLQPSHSDLVWWRLFNAVHPVHQHQPPNLKCHLTSLVFLLCLSLPFSLTLHSPNPASVCVGGYELVNHGRLKLALNVIKKWGNCCQAIVEISWVFFFNGFGRLREKAQNTIS